MIINKNSQLNNFKLDLQQLTLLNKLKKVAKRLEKKFLFKFLGREQVKNCGIYLYGGVGTGKTMLMQSFYNILKIKKLMIHYQNFMQAVHQDIHQLQNNAESRKSLISKIAKNYADKAKVICLDEFEIKDITDAMIVGTLLLELIKFKVFIFITSNTKPDDLYKDGLQRASFLPFISEIYQKFDVLHLNNEHDYRLDKILQLSDKRIFYPINKQNQLEIKRIIEKINSDNHLSSQNIEVFGRQILFSRTNGKALITNFDELFTRELSYVDYVNICQKFAIIVVENVKIIQSDDNDIAIRFINFIDNAYFYKIVLFMTLEDEPIKIYQNGFREEEFKRTVSRLYEMNSEAYLEFIPLP